MTDKDSACPKCKTILDLDGAVMKYDDGIFYTAETVCDACGVEVQVTFMACASTVIGGQSVASQ